MKTKMITMLVATLTFASVGAVWADDVDDAAQGVVDAGTQVLQEDPLAQPVQPVVEQEFIAPANDAINDDRSSGSESGD